MPLQTLLHSGAPPSLVRNTLAGPIAEGWLRKSPYKQAPPTDSAPNSAAASPHAVPGGIPHADAAAADEDLAGHSMLETAADRADNEDAASPAGAGGGDAGTHPADASVRLTGKPADSKKTARRPKAPRYKVPPVKQVRATCCHCMRISTPLAYVAMPCASTTACHAWCMHRRAHVYADALKGPHACQAFCKLSALV